ncbi:MAG: ankyrin repeat domain-containing protein [Bacteroidota bacterium]
MKNKITILIIILSGFFMQPARSFAQTNLTPDYDLLFAADTGSMKYVRIAILEGANVDARAENGITPLMYAAQGGYLDIVEFLVELDADIDAKPYHSNRTALMAAVENGYVEIAEYLIRQGADFSIRDYNKRHLMHKAALSGIWEMCDMLLYYEIPVDPLDIDNRTPLMLAAFDGFVATVDVLIENNANVNHRDIDGNTAMHMAAQNGHHEVITELINAGAELEIKNNNGFTPLDIAVMYGELNNSKTLIENGAQINDSITPAFNQLTLAKKSGNRKLIKFLKNQGAKPNYKPYFNSVGLGLSTLLNHQNTFVTGILSLHEDKYNFNFELFIGARTKRIKVPLQVTSSETYMLRESRTIAGAGITKDFDLFKPISGWKYGMGVGVQQVYTSADYKGYIPNPAGEFTTGVKSSLFAKYDFFKLTSGYKYLNLPVNEYSPHHFFINIHFYLRFRKDIYENILI